MEKPQIDVPTTPPPADLLIEDIVEGEGDVVGEGDTIKVHYVGVEYETGEEFDSSWDRGQSMEFPLQGLIEGWQKGIPGMRAGGRRKLTVPPAMAYGPAGGGHPLAGRTLIFVVDVLSAG